MGWTYYTAKFWKKGKIDRKAECDEHLTWSNENGVRRVLKSAMVGSTYYGAIEHIKPNGDRRVWCAIFLTSVDGWDFGYKDMDETCGPYQYDCPKSILDLLTPTDNEFALKWRKACYDNLEKKKAKRKNPNSLANLPIGSQIRLTMPWDTTRFNKDEVVVLTKMRRRANTTYWVTCGCYFTRNLMASLEKNCQYEVLRVGEGV